MKTDKILELAKKYSANSEMRSSAELNITDSEFWIRAGNDELARYRAIRSLQYSIGIFHPVYKLAIK